MFLLAIPQGLVRCSCGRELPIIRAVVLPFERLSHTHTQHNTHERKFGVKSAHMKK
jgi:hypothetical protein